MSGEYKLDMPVAWFVQVEGIGSTLNVASEMAKHLLDQVLGVSGFPVLTLFTNLAQP